MTRKIAASVLPISILLTVTLTLGTCVGRAWAADYYVSTSGNDQADGSRSRPWRSPQFAVDRLAAGDTLYLRQGTYRENVRLRRSGRTDHPIRISAADGETVTFSSGSISGFSISHLRVEGLRFDASGGGRPAIEFNGTGEHVEVVANEVTGLKTRDAAAIRVGGSMHHFVIANNHVHHNDTGNQEAIRVHERTHDFAILGNEVDHNTNIGIDVVGWSAFGKPRDGVIRGNYAHHNATAAPWASGIYLDGPDAILVEYNVSAFNEIGFQLGCEPANDSSRGNVMRHNIAFDNREYGFSLGGYTGGDVHHCQVYHNVFVNNKREIGFSTNAGHDNVIVNNILCNPTGQSINFLSKPTATVIDFNCYFVRYGDTPGDNSIVADPLFANAAGRDFRLLPNSPCRANGTPTAGLGKPSNERADAPARQPAPDIGSDRFTAPIKWDGKRVGT